MQGERKQTIEVLRMIDYVAMMIVESTSEMGTLERARDIRARCDRALTALQSVEAAAPSPRAAGEGAASEGEG